MFITLFFTKKELIINIKTKKNKQRGFNGSLSTTYGQGFYPKTNNSLNLNYKVGKVNIFSTLSANYRKAFEQLDINRKYTYDDKTLRAIFEQNTDREHINKNYNAKIGMDYYANQKTTFGVVLTGYSTPGRGTFRLLSITGFLTSSISSRPTRIQCMKSNIISRMPSTSTSPGSPGQPLPMSSMRMMHLRCASRLLPA